MTNWKRYAAAGTALVGILGSAGCGYSEGERVGIVNKFSEKGKMCKTWEGTMALAGSDQKEWDFTVADEGIVKKVKEAQRSMKPVVLEYKESSWHTSCSGDTDYLVTGVEYVK